MKFYELQKKMNNLSWTSIAYFRKEAAAKEALTIVEESHKQNGIRNEYVFGARLVRVQEKNFSNLKDFNY